MENFLERLINFIESYELDQTQFLYSGENLKFCDEINKYKLVCELFGGASSLGEALTFLENKYQKSAPEVYNKAQISPQSYSAYLNPQKKVKPTKDAIMALSIGFGLNEKDLFDFMKFCGYAFPTDYNDVALICFLRDNEIRNSNKFSADGYDYYVEEVLKPRYDGKSGYNFRCISRNAKEM